MASRGRQDKEWSFIPASSDIFVTGETVAQSAFTPGAAVTVLRMIGGYIIGPNVNTMALDNCRIACAIGVVSTDAFTVGGAALPDPAGSPDYPWLYHREHSFFFGGTSEGSASQTASARIAFDIKSMRKMKPVESLVFVVQYVDIVGAPNMHVSISQTRVLIGR